MEEKKKIDKVVNDFVKQQLDKGIKEADEENAGRDWDDVFLQLGRNGTDTALNENDPMGDGDQRQLTNKKQAKFHRELFAFGGHLEHLFERGMLPVFPQMCLLGRASECERMLNNCATDEAKTALLETRSYTMHHIFLHFFHSSLTLFLLIKGMVYGDTHRL